MILLFFDKKTTPVLILNHVKWVDGIQIQYELHKPLMPCATSTA